MRHRFVIERSDKGRVVVTFEAPHDIFHRNLYFKLRGWMMDTYAGWCHFSEPEGLTLQAFDVEVEEDGADAEIEENGGDG